MNPVDAVRITIRVSVRDGVTDYTIGCPEHRLEVDGAFDDRAVSTSAIDLLQGIADLVARKFEVKLCRHIRPIVGRIPELLRIPTPVEGVTMTMPIQDSLEGQASMISVPCKHGAYDSESSCAACLRERLDLVNGERDAFSNTAAELRLDRDAARIELVTLQRTNEGLRRVEEERDRWAMEFVRLVKFCAAGDLASIPDRILPVDLAIEMIQKLRASLVGSQEFAERTEQAARGMERERDDAVKHALAVKRKLEDAEARLTAAQAVIDGDASVGWKWGRWKLDDGRVLGVEFRDHDGWRGLIFSATGERREVGFYYETERLAQAAAERAAGVYVEPAKMSSSDAVHAAQVREARAIEEAAIVEEEAAERAAELRSGREPVPQDVHDRGWQWRPVGDGAFAPPFGTIRTCIDCACLVAGGSVRCGRCASPGSPWDANVRADVVRLRGIEDALREQIDRLAKFIMAEIPGEPSLSEGAVDTAIRLLRSRAAPCPPAQAPQPKCATCGHVHEGDQWAGICVGCPCEARANPPQTPPDPHDARIADLERERQQAIDAANAWEKRCLRERDTILGMRVGMGYADATIEESTNENSLGVVDVEMSPLVQRLKRDADLHEETKQKLAAAQASIRDAHEMSEHFGRTRDAAPCNSKCKTSRKGDDRYPTCDRHRPDIDPEQCSEGADGGDGCARCVLADALSGGTDAVNTVLMREVDTVLQRALQICASIAQTAQAKAGGSNPVSRGADECGEAIAALRSRERARFYTPSSAPEASTKATTDGPHVMVHKALLAELQESRDALRAQLERLRVEDEKIVDALRAQNTRLGESLSDAMKSARERERTVALLRSEFGDRLAAWEVVRKDLIDERSSLQEQNDRLRTQHRGFREHHERNAQRYAAQDAEVAALRAEVARLQKLLSPPSTKEIHFGAIVVGDVVLVRGRWRKVTGRGDFGRLLFGETDGTAALPLAIPQDEVKDVIGLGTDEAKNFEGLVKDLDELAR